MLLLCNTPDFAVGGVQVIAVDERGMIQAEVTEEYGAFTYGQIAALLNGRAALLGSKGQGEAPEALAALAIATIK